MADNTQQMWAGGTDGSTLIHIDRAGQPHQSLGRLFTYNLARDPRVSLEGQMLQRPGHKTPQQVIPTPAPRRPKPRPEGCLFIS